MTILSKKIEKPNYWKQNLIKYFISVKKKIGKVVIRLDEKNKPVIDRVSENLEKNFEEIKQFLLGDINDYKKRKKKTI